MNVVKVQIRNCNLILTVTDREADIVPKAVPVKEIEDGRYIFHYADNEHGVARFGLEATNPAERPGHGGLWSSSFESVKYYLDKDVVPCSIITAEGYMMGAHLHKDVFMKHMPEGYRLVSGYKVMKVFSRKAKLNREVAFV